jgi:hypothetical protein
MPTDTHPDRASRLRDCPHGITVSPLFLALVVALANTLKPVMIDDTAYLRYARQAATNPTDPYGFAMFWYDVPEPAFEILCPPLVPYWLALGMSLFGEHVGLLKLWLFPFLVLLAWSLRDLLRRFARGTERTLLPLLMLSPAVLPTVNLMLDVPASALMFTGVALFTRAVDHRSWRIAAAAGLILGAAMQTKYTALLAPPVILCYGWTHRRLLPAFATACIAVGVFAGWEILMAAKYGRSHFAHHALSRSPAAGDGEDMVGAFLEDKVVLAHALSAHLGCLAVGPALIAGAALRVRSGVLKVASAVWGMGFLLILLLPLRFTVLAPANPPFGPDTRPVTGFWQTYGTFLLIGSAACAGLLLFQLRPRPRYRGNADTGFLATWLLIEIVGYFVLTPFGAARRVIGITLVGGLLAARALSRTQRLPGHNLGQGWIAAFGISVGVAVFAVDVLDSYPEKVCAEIAASIAETRPSESRVWFVGHWGFQFYCERQGMQQVMPGGTVMRPGDVFVFPTYPDPHGFYRPHMGTVLFSPPESAMDIITEVVWDDAIAAQTVPNFYCGIDPIIGRDHPRLRVVVYRVKAEWAVPRK